MVHTRIIQVINRVKSLLIILLLLEPVTIKNIYASTGSFYQGDNKYKGFYWFESKQSDDKGKSAKENYYPTPKEAKKAIEMRKKALDDARNQMVELAFIKDTPPQILREAIIKYKKLESDMYDGAIRLTYANEMANFTNPEIANKAEYPTNVFANKIKRKKDDEERLEVIREFAKEFDLLVFTEDNCPYSKAFDPVITRFAKDHGFSLDKSSLASSEGEIAQNLGIKSTPTLIAVSKDAKEMFEISRSMVSLSELESSIVLSSKYSNESKMESNYKNKKSKR